MFYIKSDNIEELFREAAEKYEVDTSAAEAWEDVKAAVHADDAPPTTPQPDGGRKRRWFALWWLLLIPLGWFAHNAWITLRAPATTHTAQQPAKSQSPDEATNTQHKELTNKDAINNAQTAVATKGLASKTNLAEKPPFNAAGNNVAGKTGSYKTGAGQTAAAGYTFKAGPGSNPTGPTLINPATNAAGTALDNGGAQPGSKQTVLNYPGTVAQPKSPDNGGQPVQPAAGNLANTKAIPENGQQAQNAAAQGSSNSGNTPGGKKQEAHEKSTEKSGGYFYGGVSVSPDLSFIQFQKASSLGTGAGVLLGYQFSKHFAVETGATVEKKYYYTDGEYFDISKVPYFMANNIHPISVNGNCDMVEIPLNLRYTINTKSKNRFYIIGGMSSYLMGHEDYTFNYKEWGTLQQSTWNYNNKSNYWFAILNLGAGYERTLNKKTNFRIEPYFKQPLSGLGTGSLKIASTGVYLTLTRKIP